MQNIQTHRDKNKDIWLSSQFTKFCTDLIEETFAEEGSVIMNVDNDDIMLTE